MSKAAITQRVKIIVPAGKASPSPPVGPALGARGVKAMDFCKEFNARTAHLKTDVPTPTSITIAPDRTFTFDFRTPPTVWLLKKAANMPIGAAPPSKAKMELSLKHIYAIAQVKMMDADLAAVGERAVVKQIIGTAKTLGLTVVA